MHVLAIGADEADTEEGFRRADTAGEVAGDANEGLGGSQHLDHRVQRRVGFDVVHQRLMVVDAVGGGVAGAEQEVAGAVNGEVAAVLHDAGFETGEDVGDEAAEHQQGERAHGNEGGGHQRAAAVAGDVAEGEAKHHGTSTPSRMVKI